MTNLNNGTTAVETGSQYALDAEEQAVITKHLEDVEMLNAQVEADKARKPHFNVRDILPGIKDEISSWALFDTNNYITIDDSGDASAAILLGLSFLNGSAPARPGCSTTEEANILIMTATRWLTSQPLIDRFNPATDVTFNVWAVDGVPRPGGSGDAMMLMQRYFQYRVERELNDSVAN